MTESLRKTLAELSHRTALAAVGEFATSLSHEVRNSLTSIRVDLQRAAKKPPGDVSGRDLVLRALDNIAHLDSSVSGALRVARSAHSSLAPVDIRGVLQSAASIVAGTFAALPATLDLADATAEPIMVRGDAMALEQLFTNLLFNAAQALRPDGRAVITTSVESTHAVIVIADNGIGMDEQQLANARQPFFSSKPYGTGVGLTIARQICAAHEGELAISSSVGVGTTVEVRLPIIAAAVVVPATMA
jgi:signal transduction histidine kinase